MQKSVERLFLKSDEPDLFELARLSPMKLPGLDLIYDRTPQFQDLLMCQSDHYETYVSYLANELLGHASISWRSRLVNGKKCGVAYLGDLRMRHRRESARAWRDFYQVLLSDEYRKARGIDYYLTAVLSENKVAIKNLTQSRNNKFRYHAIGRQMMVNVLGMLPRFPSSKKRVNVEPWKFDPSWWDKAERKHFDYFWTENENEFREKHWPGYKDRSWMRVADGSRTLCVTHPWSPTPAKRMTIDNVDWKMSFLLQMTRAFGMPPVSEGKHLETLYLTGLRFLQGLSSSQKAEALSALIENEIKRSIRPHMVSFADSEGLHRQPALRSRFILNKTEVVLFQVTRLDEEPLSLTPDLNIEFEMALV